MRSVAFTSITTSPLSRRGSLLSKVPLHGSDETPLPHPSVLRTRPTLITKPFTLASTPSSPRPSVGRSRQAHKVALRTLFHTGSGGPDRLRAQPSRPRRPPRWPFRPHRKPR